MDDKIGKIPKCWSKKEAKGYRRLQKGLADYNCDTWLGARPEVNPNYL